MGKLINLSEYPFLHLKKERKKTYFVRILVDGGSVAKNPPANAGDVDSIPGSGRPLEEGNGNSSHYSFLEKSHGQRSLVGLHPWELQKSLTTQLRN